jgi:ABC-type nitrate/sulfonate/bicarbonate transport system substrate-binding protein
MGAASGLRVLQSACDLLPHYQGISGTARRAWARANRDLLVRFIQAYLEALDWLYRSDNRANARDLLLKHVPTLGQEIAQATCDILLAARLAFIPRRGSMMKAQPRCCGCEPNTHNRRNFSHSPKNIST